MNWKVIEIKTISTDELKQRLEAGETLNLVDVREDEEVAGGMIPEAVHIKMGKIPDSLDFFDKDEEYIFICRSGRRSENVSRFMEEQGFKVVNMEGGMLEWIGELILRNEHNSI
jgi:rhodanese-related sulfurtransferase